MIKKKCIGLTGRMGCGKGEAAEFLKEKGYRYISLSDIVREEVARRGKEINRAEMMDVGNSLRESGGAGVLGRLVREKITASVREKWVIDGIRNPSEVEELRKIDSFFLLGVDAHIEVLLNRMKSRGRGTDLADEAELKKRLDREWGIGEPEGGQQVGKCMGMADVTITNNKDLTDLKTALLELL